MIGSIVLMDSGVPGFGPIAAGRDARDARRRRDAGDDLARNRARRRPVVTGTEQLVGDHAEAPEVFSGHGRAHLWRGLECRRDGRWPPASGSASRAWRLTPHVVPKSNRRTPMIATSPGRAAGAVINARKILREYERGVVFTLGRFTGVKGPGLIVLVPGIQKMARVDLRTIVLDAEAGRHLARQRLGQGQRGRSFPDRRSGQGDHPVANPFEAPPASRRRRCAGAGPARARRCSRSERLNADVPILDASTDARARISHVEIKHVDLDESMIRAMAPPRLMCAARQGDSRRGRAAGRSGAGRGGPVAGPPNRCIASPPSWPKKSRISAPMDYHAAGALEARRAGGRPRTQRPGSRSRTRAPPSVLVPSSSVPV